MGMELAHSDPLWCRSVQAVDPNMLWHEPAGSGSWGLTHVSRQHWLNWHLPPELTHLIQKENVQVILVWYRSVKSVCSNIEYVSKWPWIRTQVRTSSSSVMFSDPSTRILFANAQGITEAQWIQIISSLPLLAAKRLLLCSSAHCFCMLPYAPVVCIPHSISTFQRTCLYCRRKWPIRELRPFSMKKNVFVSGYLGRLG